MSVVATLLRAAATRSEYRRDGASVTSPRYWLHRLATARLRRLADRLEADR